ncbi:MAG: thiamine-phosphate kinase [Thermaerobacter sp.]|nr:thiamine-phosphate kinase [Thermaerobacter sp.]
MNIRDVGERGLIALIHRLQTTPPLGYIGIGDDAAYVPPSATGWLISQDMLVETIHFRWDWMTPEQVGAKAVAVNVSDIAAMGGVPKAILTSLSVPAALRVEAVEDLYRGMTRALDLCGAVLIGGDTVGSPDRLVIDVTVLGHPGPVGPVRRTGARPGDRLVVTGRLGAAHAGLMLLSHGVMWPSHSVHERSVQVAHIAPKARWECGVPIGQAAHALTDISDGLYAEIEELTRFGGIGATLFGEALPIDQATRAVARAFRADPIEYALYGGEDYELLAAIAPSKIAEVMRIATQTGVAITEVGVITDDPGIRLLRDGEEVKLGGEQTFNHFRVDRSS